MKTLLLSTIMMFSLVKGSSQFAADFTATDINGQEHNLYDLLDDGKMVVLDIFTTWCTPCWTIHEEGTLKDLYDEFGPDGTDEIYVFSIEADLSTNIDDLMGITTETKGDWITGTPYPIIDDVVPGTDNNQGVIADNYDVFGYPTIFFVCPDRSFTAVPYTEIDAQFAERLSDCGTPAILNDLDVQVESFQTIGGDYCDVQSLAPSVSVRNIGNEDIVSFDAVLTINGQVEQTISFMDNIPTYDFTIISFDELNFSAGGYDLSIEIINVNKNGVVDDAPDNNISNSSAYIASETNTDSVTVSVMTESDGDAIYWNIVNEDNNELVAEGGNIEVGLDKKSFLNGPLVPSSSSAYENNTLYDTRVNLENEGCYRFSINDYFSDGFTTDGFVSVVDDNDRVIVENYSFSGPFTFINISTPIRKSGTSSTVEFQSNTISAYPNPAQDRLNINMEINDQNSFHFMIINSVGEVVRVYAGEQYRKGEYSKTLDVSELIEGLYFLVVKSKSYQTSIKFSILN